MKAIFIAGLLAMSAPTWATTYYVSNCADGAAASCVAGNDSNPGTNPSAPKQSTAAARALINASQPSDQVLFARGGSWINAHMTLTATGPNAEQPVVIGAYTPAWCAGACAASKPLLTEARPFGDGQAGHNDNALLQLQGGSGYLFKDLELRGGRDQTWGVFITGGAHDVTIQNLMIRDFSIGVYCGIKNPRVQLLESTITGNYEHGTLWGCIDSLVENNAFDNNGYKKIYDQNGTILHARLHNIYINIESENGEAVGRNITLRGNKLTRNALLDGKCDGGSLIAHGAIDGLLIENNLLYEVPDAKGSVGCYGIAVDAGYGTHEAFRNVVIRGNTIVNLPHTAIGCSSCIAPVIENNVIVQEAGMSEFYGIVVPDQNRAGSDVRNTGAKIRNNSIYVAKGKAGSAINLAEYSENAGSDLEVTNNLIFMAAEVDSEHACFNIAGLKLSNFKTIANNLCYHEGGNGIGFWSNNRKGETIKTLADAQKAGFDVHGKSADPLLVAVPSQANGWSMKVRAGSPVIDAGHATSKARNSYKGYVRSGVADIGAYEYGVMP